MAYTPAMTMDDNANLGMTETENPADGSYNSLNPLIVVELERGKFSLPTGAIVAIVGVGAFVGVLVMFRSKSNDAVVEDTDAAAVTDAAVEVPASAAVTVVVAAAGVVVASVVDAITAGQQVFSKPFTCVQTSLDSETSAASAIMSSQVISPTRRVAPEAVRPPAQTEQATKSPTGQQVPSDC
jgi:hypothetical protein